MSRLDVPSRLYVFPRIAVFSLIAVAAAGCADSARFSSNDPPPQDVTGSVARRTTSRVETQALPAIGPDDLVLLRMEDAALP